MTPAEQTLWILARARASGFDLCGVTSVKLDVGTASDASAPPWEELGRLPEWLARGYAGEMKYLHDPRRTDPRRVLDGTRSVIVVALNYHSPQPLSTELRPQSRDESPRGWISRYAWGDDYHGLMLPKLEALIAEMRELFPEPFEARAYVDTGPILERVAAKYAGLGWLAKNTCLINPQLGSWLFLGVIVTSLALEPTVGPASTPPRDLCGTCTRCLDACPTQAFPEPYVLDARRCISYLTIELRGVIPEELRRRLGAAVFGCDICQDVCPWNRKAPATHLAAFQPREINEDRNSKCETSNPGTDSEPLRVSDAEFRHSLFAPELGWLVALSQAEFSAIFRGSAVKRAKWRGVVRNACVALGNSGIAPGSEAYPRIIQLLERLASSGDAMLAEHARWALAQLSAAAAAPVPPAQ